MIIYRFLNRLNGHCYIGQTKGNPEARRQNHLADARRGVDSPLCNAIRKHGNDIEFSVIASVLNQEYLDTVEILLIEQHRSYDDGYNQTRGGRGWSSDVVKEMAKTRPLDNYPEAARKRALQLLEEGRHNFQGEQGRLNAERSNAKQMADGTHMSTKIRICPHCGHSGRGANIYRYHFNNCKTNG